MESLAIFLVYVLLPKHLKPKYCYRWLRLCMYPVLDVWPSPNGVFKGAGVS